MTAHDNLKGEFEEFRDSVMQELIVGVFDPAMPTRLDKIEKRLTRIEKFIFGDTPPSKIILPGE